MNRRISRKMQQSSVELSLNNGIMNSQSSWSRCNSYSSSSSDSTLYCSNSPQRSSFSGRKRLKSDEPIAKMVKRSRNSSGSSASSNLSCISDKDINRMPALISSDQVSHGINNIETLADISPSTLELQHEALLNSRLAHPLDMNAALPFRHNLRRNIRRKTCSCDCTATCTTVVVSRQYKGIGEQTVEEKTVISRTKVKTFVESNAAQTPIRQVQMSSKVSVQENMAHKNECSFQETETHKNECNKKRRTEIERLYDSLHEMKFAKDFSPDNIVQQFNGSNTAEPPLRQVRMSSKVSFQENVAHENECAFQENVNHENERSFKKNLTHENEFLFHENVAHKNECNRKRRSEIEKLYDSLHEIKWAKSFSPDNILRQFDVRKAASCSAFGKAYAAKPAKSDNKANECSEVSGTKMPNESDIKINKPNLTRRNNMYTTRSKSRSLRNSENKFKEDDSNPPVLEKSIITADEALNIDSPHYNTFPVLSKEVLTSANNVDFSTSCNTIETLSNFPKAMLNFDLNSHCNIDSPNIADCSSTFFDIMEDKIHTIDACFREVGAEVVISTCCDTEFSNLPLLTAVKEIHSSNIKSISHDCPPTLEPLLQECGSSLRFSHENCSSVSDVRCSQLVEPFKKFFPQIKPHSISEEDYSPPFSFLENVKKNYAVEDNEEKNYTFEEDNEKKYVDKDSNARTYAVQSFCDINNDVIIDNNLKISPILPSLTSVGETKTLDQNIIFERPPVLEPCISNEVCFVNIKSEISITENIKNEETKNISGNLSDKANCIKYRTNNHSIKSKNVSQICKSVKTRLRSKSFIVSSGRRILKKYMRFVNSKSKRPTKLSKVCNRSLKCSVVSQKASPISNNLCSMENIVSNDSSASEIPLSLSDSAQIPSSVEFINSSTFSHSSPSQITEKCISASESRQQSAGTVTNAKSATVIQSFNQKLSFSTSQENITLNQIKNSSILIQAEKKPCLNNKKVKKPSLNNIFNNHYSEHFADIPGYSKILAAAKKKDGHTEEKVKIPPRVFTCHFQTINVTRGNDYIQIVLKITRGKSIYLTHETLVELKEAIIKAGNDKDCRLLILNGFGQTFCLGLDLRPLVGDRKNQAASELANAVKDLIGTLADFQKPLVAIVNGAAYGLGLTILNHADVTLATSNASFCMPYSRLGYMPEGGATLTLPQAVGTTVAMDLILRGQVITAEQARDIGLVNEVVEVRHLPQDLVSRVKAIAENSLPGMEATKAMIKMRLHIQLPLVLETEAKLLPQMWLSPSCQEAIQSALKSGFFEDC